MNFLASLFLDGKIPFYSFLQKSLLFASFPVLAGVFLFPDDYRVLGTLCWVLLLLIVALRPLGDIFPDFRILRTLLPLRKEAGILCGVAGIAHSIGYFFSVKIPLPNGFFFPEMWDPSTLFFWGMMGFIIAILLTVTSSLFFMKLLKRNWKRLHRLVYPFVIVVALHLAFVEIGRGRPVMDPEVLFVAVPVIGLSILWTLSARNVQFRFARNRASQA